MKFDIKFQNFQTYQTLHHFSLSAFFLNFFPGGIAGGVDNTTSTSTSTSTFPLLSATLSYTLHASKMYSNLWDKKDENENIVTDVNEISVEIKTEIENENVTTINEIINQMEIDVQEGEEEEDGEDWEQVSVHEGAKFGVPNSIMKDGTKVEKKNEKDVINKIKKDPRTITVAASGPLIKTEFLMEQNIFVSKLSLGNLNQITQLFF